MDKNKSDLSENREKLEDEIKQAVQTGDDIRDAVRRITLKALNQGKLNTKEVQQVVSAVVKGASEGAVNQGLKSKDSLLSAVSGLDDALSWVAEASKLALEEAAGDIKTFAKQDVKKITDDLLVLEDIYLETLKRVAKESNKLIGSTLNNIERHARDSGTAVGRQTTEIVNMLNYQLGENLSETVAAGSDSALKLASQLSYAAAGFLDGIAQTLESKLKTTSLKNKK
ncbi:conserved hypothetical protein [Psychromonas ingrahamii 37]|uniref:Uncharacterized protein n=1 Tax=Psychromonas ingrahamii (strain DSM 17664 / CCUG 51855 / 37) TaxID=357804 RepID=A1SYJ4_PSYIN|nr:DUF6781 family protein [Psychromonas ingrahamii]ABM04559.1 conserved hypothetical protein [Psychromonas ingrahamii 37]